MLFKKNYIDRLTKVTISLNHYQTSIFGDYELADQENIYNDILTHIVALANTKGGQIILGYSKNFPQELELTGRDIYPICQKVKNLASQWIQSDYDKEPDIIKSFSIGVAKDKPVLAINIKKGPHPAYKKYEHIYSFSEEEDRPQGDKKIFLREYDSGLNQFITKMYSVREYRDKRLSLDFADDFLAAEYSHISSFKKHPMLIDNKHMKEHVKHAYIQIEDQVSDYEWIYNKIINEPSVQNKYSDVTEYISFDRDGVRIGGTIRAQASSLYAYFKHCVGRLLSPEDKSQEDVKKFIARELILNSLIHRNYAIQRPIQIKKTKLTLQIITPGALHSAVNLADLENSDQEINKIARNEMLYQYSANRSKFDLQNIFNIYQNDKYIDFHLIEAEDSLIIYIENKDKSSSREAISRKQHKIMEILHKKKANHPENPGMNRKELMRRLGYTKTPSNFYKTHLRELLNQSYLALTIPDKPKSPKQSYKITEEGRLQL